MFTKKQVWALIIPLMIEQVLNALMGAADTMMVSNAGSAAISAVSLVDSINILVLYVFTAMATGGTIVAIRRGQTVILSPGPYAQLYGGDVIVLVGSPAAAEAAHRLVTEKEVP